jgi:hypothetical protein
MFYSTQGLDVHYGRDHWACHDPKCKERRFVAFEDEFQLTLHLQVGGLSVSFLALLTSSFPAFTSVSSPKAQSNGSVCILGARSSISM